MRFKKRFSIVERQEIVDQSVKCIWSNKGGPGRDYLINSRSLSEKVIKEFCIGYLPDYIDHQLRDRIILPVYDPSGNLVAIGSRAIRKSDFLPVYWHESYEKRFYLYGILNAFESIQKHKFVIATEGQIDVLQSHNHGVKNVVGLCGNKLSEVQMSILRRYCQDIILCLDTDKNRSGQKGASKVLDNSKFVHSWKIGNSNQSSFSFIRKSIINRSIASVSFPEHSDPDEFIKKYGVNKYKEIIREKLHELRCSDDAKY